MTAKKLMRLTGKDRLYEDILSGYLHPQDTLLKLVLPCVQIREQGLRELYRMPIPQATLFLGLDGLARSLTYELKFHWEYDPHIQGVGSDVE